MAQKPAVFQAFTATANINLVLQLCRVRIYAEKRKRNNASRVNLPSSTAYGFRIPQKKEEERHIWAVRWLYEDSIKSILILCKNSK